MNLDDAYEYLHGTGPEFGGWLSNHGPMAVDALDRIGHQAGIERWVTAYASLLDERPGERWKVTEAEWPELLGDTSRLGDWLAHFERAVAQEPWRTLLARWWPRLLPGSVASATHCLIRTGHAVRALLDAETAPRLMELAHSLGYWAARWQPLPRTVAPTGDLDAATGLARLPRLKLEGGPRTRLRELGKNTEWSAASNALAAVDQPSEVPAALDSLVDAAVTGYGRFFNASSVMLIHAATAPRAAALALPALPRDMWVPTYNAAWSTASIITALYSRAGSPQSQSLVEANLAREEICDRAVLNGDEHVVKFTEVALESHERGNIRALQAAATAIEKIPAADWRPGV